MNKEKKFLVMGLRYVRLKFINMILDSSIIFYILLTFSITSVKLLYIVFPFLLS